MPTMIDPDLKQIILNVILGTVAQSENRNDLWKLSDEIALNVTVFVQDRDVKTQASVANINPKRERVNLAAKLAIVKPVEKDAVPNTTAGADVSSGAFFSDSLKNTTRKATLPQENSNGTRAFFDPTDSNLESVAAPADVPSVAISPELDDCLSKHDGEPLPISGNDPISTEARGALSKILKKNAENRKCAKNAHTLDDLESPGGYFPPAGDGPVWMAEQLNLAEYWVYDYSSPCTTRHGKTGNPAAQTELWLVHRRKYKLVVVDVEFDSLDSLHDFLDPRKELARENKITPLEKIDEELAGKEEKLRNQCRAARKQTQFNRFVEYYHQFNGDAAKIASAMGIQKQSVYAYKNKAKDMGVLK